MIEEIKTTMYIGDDDKEVVVYGDYWPAEKGKRESGMQIEPDLDSDIIFNGAEDLEGNEVLLGDEDKKWAIQALWDIYSW